MSNSIHYISEIKYIFTTANLKMIQQTLYLLSIGFIIILGAVSKCLFVKMKIHTNTKIFENCLPYLKKNMYRSQR